MLESPFGTIGREVPVVRCHRSSALVAWPALLIRIPMRIRSFVDGRSEESEP